MKTLRKIEKIAFVLFITISGTTLTACSSDEDEDKLEKTEGHTKNENKIISQLVGTSWTTYRTIFYDYNNKEVSTYDNTKYPDIITFTGKRAYS